MGRSMNHVVESNESQSTTVLTPEEVELNRKARAYVKAVREAHLEGGVLYDQASVRNGSLVVKSVKGIARKHEQLLPPMRGLGRKINPKTGISERKKS